ncbi:MAG: MarR family transcriptional regulator [Gordonia sp. (in: high G+C Gram-positive bacteria)]
MPTGNQHPVTEPDTTTNELAIEVWQIIGNLVADSRENWKRSLITETGLPFSRIRVLRRLDTAPMTISQIAAAATIDTPAASVAVSHLEAAGYVVREASPHDRRSKQVRITDPGRELVNRIRALEDPPPDVLRGASTEELQVILNVLRRNHSAES